MIHIRKKIFLCSLIVLIGFCATIKAQTISPIMMRLTNGQIFTDKNIKMGKPLVIIYFSPDCEHCEALAKNVSSASKSLSNIEIVMVTYLPMAPVVAFDNQYGLSRNSNIHIGSEGLRLTVKNFYKVQNFPFLVLYNSKGRLIHTFHSEEKPTFLIKQMEALK